MLAAVIARLLITPKDKDREINSEPDQDRAKTDRDHVELAENENADRERDETTKQERESHAEERQPPIEAEPEDCAYQHDRAEERDHVVVAHAERNLRDISGAAGDQDLERAAVPAFRRLRAEGVHFLH